MRKKYKLVYGWGVNDVNYPVTRSEVINCKKSTVWVCPYYAKWCSMLGRCFDPKYQETHPTYVGCTICEEWKYLSNFIKWVDSQTNKNWEVCQLDKDILSAGNKHYSPDTVVFVSSKVNKFITDCGGSRGKYMIGVCYTPQNSKKNPYKANCCDPFTSKQKHVGMFPTELEAHKAWQACKHEIACMLSDLQEDERVAKALRERYAPDKDWTKV